MRVREDIRSSWRTTSSFLAKLTMTQRKQGSAFRECKENNSVVQMWHLSLVRLTDFYFDQKRRRLNSIFGPKAVKNGKKLARQCNKLARQCKKLARECKKLANHFKKLANNCKAMQELARQGKNLQETCKPNEKPQKSDF